MVNLPILSKTWFLTKNLTSKPTRVWLIVSYGSWLTCLAWYLTPIVVNYNKPQHHHQNIFTRQTSEALTLVVLVYLLSAYVIKFLLLRIWLAIRLLAGRCLVACIVRDRKLMYLILCKLWVIEIRQHADTVTHYMPSSDFCHLCESECWEKKVMFCRINVSYLVYNQLQIPYKHLQSCNNVKLWFQRIVSGVCQFAAGWLLNFAVTCVSLSHCLFSV